MRTQQLIGLVLLMSVLIFAAAAEAQAKPMARAFFTSWISDKVEQIGNAYRLLRATDTPIMSAISYWWRNRN